MSQKLKLCLCLFLLILIVNVEGFSQESKNKPLLVNNGPNLFLDDYLIGELSFLTRTVNNPQKLPEPILVGGKKNDQVFQP